jgi:hypothetical protein
VTRAGQLAQTFPVGGPAVTTGSRSDTLAPLRWVHPGILAMASVGVRRRAGDRSGTSLMSRSRSAGLGDVGAGPQLKTNLRPLRTSQLASVRSRSSG